MSKRSPGRGEKGAAADLAAPVCNPGTTDLPAGFVSVPSRRLVTIDTGDPIVGELDGAIVKWTPHLAPTAPDPDVAAVRARLLERGASVVLYRPRRARVEVDRAKRERLDLAEEAQRMALELAAGDAELAQRAHVIAFECGEEAGL